MTPDQRDDVEAALLAYWTARDEAALAQQLRGVSDQGARAGVTAGTHLDRVAQLLARVCLKAGVPPKQVFFKAPKDDEHYRSRMKDGCTLPGYYRPTKDWDLVIYSPAGAPIVAVELKSQNGPSYGNNANNRAEESIGNAVDLRRAVDAKLLPFMPWTGYIYVIEDDRRSAAVGGARKIGPFTRDGVFSQWSYQGRVRELSRRLVADGLYDGAWPVATSRPTCPDQGRSSEDLKCPQLKAGISPCNHTFDWFELDATTLGYQEFVRGMTAAISLHYPDTASDPEITLI